EGQQVHFSVVDRGCGIPRREQKNVFQKFYRIDDSLSRDVEGSGLGLAIVRHVATGHGGRVDLVSAPGVGSTFTLVLPLPSARQLQRLKVERSQQQTTPRTTLGANPVSATHS
ncbi:MAG TPA: ATP-binding protein, partial [Sorangium sp.]|nr:ATP-binding protein [Sorangium sp.]